jgi:UDP-GlcNAc:undecaprenyl-phosphate GlcNAc-1-phosphate transferase
LIGHFIVGYIIVMMADIRITSLYGLFGVELLEPHVSIAFSFFVYIVLVNAINLIDGVDGLAAGIGFISAVAFGTWFYLAGNVPDTLLSAVLAGALLAFLVFNFSPARVFMGDSGSLIIGAIITVLAMKMIEGDPSSLPIQIRGLPKPIFAMAIIAYPLIDTFRIFIYRMSKGTSPFAADRNHIHHRLMKLGAGHRTTVYILYFYTVVMIGVSLLMRDVNITYGLLITGSVGFILLFIPFIIKPKN